METQANQLKLNVTNIQSYLIRSNRELKKLRTDKTNLFSKLEKRNKQREKETKLETKNLGVGSTFTGIYNKVTSPARGIMDKILDFFGLIALGILVNKLPLIVTKINEFFDSDFYKGIKFVVSGIVKGAVFLFDIATTLTAANMQRLENEKKYYENSLDQIGRDLDSAKNFFANMFGSNSNNTPMPLSPFSGMFPTLPSGSGPSPLFNWPQPKPPVNRSKGGTIPGHSDSKGGSQNKPQTPRVSGETEAARRNMNDGFVNFERLAEVADEYAQKEKDNLDLTRRAVENFNKASIVGTATSTSARPRTPPGAGINGAGPWSPLTTPSGVSIDATGEPGVDFTPAGLNVRSLFDGVVVSDPAGTNHQFNASTGRGYGNFMIIRHKDPDTGTEFDALYAHFPDQNFPKPGTKVKKGQILGRMGQLSDPLEERGSITGPHMSVDFYPAGGPYNPKTSAYSRWLNIANLVDPTFGGNPPANGIGGSGGINGVGSNRKLVNTSGRGGNQSVFVYAVQPVETFVPFPYSVPIKTASSSPAPSRKKLPEIWRVG